MRRPKHLSKAESAPKTAVIYARVSTREQELEGYSLDAQLALLRTYAARESFTILGEFVESETAKVSGRPAFTAMLKLVKERSVSAILVEKTDRLYRNLKDYVRVDDLGVAVHLVKESEVISKDSRSHQKFVHGIKLLVAKNYSDNLSEETKKGMLEKARQGIWPTKAPLGYLNVSHGGRRVIEPDAERAPLVRSMFVRYAEGEVALKTLRNEMAARGLTTRQGKRVAVNEVQKILLNPVYHGLVVWDGEEHAGIHEPIVDKATWQRVQNVMARRSQLNDKPATTRDFLYRGLFTCGTCGCMISPQKTKGHHYYACTGARGCTRKTVREEAITEAIAERLSHMAIRPEVMDALIRTLVESESEETRYREDELARLRRGEAQLRDNLRRLYLDYMTGKVSEQIYVELKAQWEVELAAAESMVQAFGSARRRYEDECLKLRDFALNAYQRFKTASGIDRREMARNLLSNSTITNGSVQVRLHEAFEMILEENARIAEIGLEKPDLMKWLPL